ncbi:cupin domain-containing protein [Streptomyces sp. NPDC006530]|uniref:cupin domain-containing protein n=1 Tax=Streptomyces sp. NPDC006530 TaxID=3364750 RepID=UPI0036ACB8F3
MTGPSLPTRSAEGLIVPAGEGRVLAAEAQHVTYKVTGEHSVAASTFEVLVPPGFDVGAHAHTHSEELFYVLDGELDVLAFEPRVRTPDSWRSWQSHAGKRAMKATPGTLIHIPPGCPHAFANTSGVTAKMLFQSSPPPAHERYFEELLDILTSGAKPAERDAAIDALRTRYDIQQITPLRYDPPGPE